MKQKVALITGITGQDGAYLSEFLLKKNYVVHGLKRRSSLFNTSRIDHIYEKYEQSELNQKKFFLHYGDLADGYSLLKLINEVKPDEIYNLGAMSHVQISFQIPEYVANIDGLGALRILESVRALKLEKKVKIYQASTSELYGNVMEIPQNENTPFKPRSPYAISKLYAYWISVNYRQAHKMFVSNGILFNHESPLRGETFVTRKITRGISKILYNQQKTILLGNLDAKRDWGHAKDFVEAMWLILQYKTSDDWVISTGKTYSIREFITLAFKYVGIKIKFEGTGINEKGVVVSCSNPKYEIKKSSVVIEVSSKYFRPTEVALLKGDSSKAKKLLGWSSKHTITQIVAEMMESDLKITEREFERSK